ncbi:hypothetical protein J3459_015275 [Metarhizium acridum]|uniref:Uncharacterized protein n=1 Tax=Metarhizium acridum (strain CQMa 102) TaxID=655827 RepID=E9DUZ5_METAQ|nr:uncharacterized protein MAC_01528 [Metarhizium acridum CQMa 102]EFY92562.1 hypothetical protein MAC_01528 [Metarhizium acridum CQMa 102]KAG8413530.1 hypothetical protein J3459_015275 [Metarhizium acridum]KAG8413993.1 hypothetical protein J3458_011648 [Metarhizium acridum]
MAAQVAKYSVLPRIDMALEMQDFRASGELYNTLLDDSDQPPVSEEHITDLAQMFVRHNADKVLGIHLIHGHFKIPKNTVMLGSNFENPSLRWTKVTDIDEIDPSRVHGHILALYQGGLCAYELQDGPLPDLSGVGPGFLDEFINYIIKKNLTSLIGLQILGCSDGSMSELILDQATVMVESTFAKNTVPTRMMYHWLEIRGEW